MKTLIAALAVTLGVLSTALPAAAAYVSPDASYVTRAFTSAHD